MATSDYFALLDQPRRPWLDPDCVQAKFLALSAEVHPDRIHAAPADQKAAANERFASLNTAWQCLRDPKERLRHLLELERGAKPNPLEKLPSRAADFYFSMGQVCREADAFLTDKAQAASPLLKVRVFQQALDWTDKLQTLQKDLGLRLQKLDEELKSLNSAWEKATEPGTPEPARLLPLDQLEEIYRELSYAVRWSRQIGERVVELSL